MSRSSPNPATSLGDADSILLANLKGALTDLRKCVDNMPNLNHEIRLDNIIEELDSLCKDTESKLKYRSKRKQL